LQGADGDVSGTGATRGSVERKKWRIRDMFAGGKNRISLNLRSAPGPNFASDKVVRSRQACNTGATMLGLLSGRNNGGPHLKIRALVEDSNHQGVLLMMGFSGRHNGGRKAGLGPVFYGLWGKKLRPGWIQFCPTVSERLVQKGARGLRQSGSQKKRHRTAGH